MNSRGSNWKKKVATWLSRSGDKPAAIVLRCGADPAPATIDRYAVSESDDEDADTTFCDGIVDAFIATAEEDVEALGTRRESYYLAALDDSGLELERTTRIAFEAESTNEPGATEPGMFDLMKNVLNLLVRTTGSNSDMLVGRVNKLESLMEETLTRRIELAHKTEEAINERHLRELDQQKEETRQKQVGAVIERVNHIVLPALASRLLGQGPVTTDASGRQLAESVTTFLSSIPQDALEHLMAALPTEKQLELGSLVALMQRIKGEEDGNGSAEADN